MNVISNFASVLNGFAAEENRIYVFSGEVILERAVLINKKNVTFIGDGTTVITKHYGSNGIEVDENGDGFRMINIKIKEVEDKRDQNVSEEEKKRRNDEGREKGCCLVVKANNTLIESCTFESFGKERNFTVYYPGPKECVGKTMVNKLSKGNKFINNIIKTDTVRKCNNLFFAFQENGLVFGNHIEGMLGVFICKKVAVTGNTLECKNNPSIFVSTPSVSISIVNNTLGSTETVWSAILFKRYSEEENANIIGFRDINDVAHHYHVITNNKIKRKRCGIELRGPDVYEVLIAGNRFNQQQELNDDGQPWEIDFRRIETYVAPELEGHVTELNNAVEEM